MGQAIVALMLVRYLTQTIVIALCGGIINMISSEGNKGQQGYRVAFLLSLLFAVVRSACRAFGIFRRAPTQPFHTAGNGAYSDDPNAPPVEVIPESEWTEGMRVIYEYTQGVAKRMSGKALIIRFVHWPRREGGTWRACYGACHLLGMSMFDYNVGVLGRNWFDSGVTEDTDSLILHELGHEFCTNHADENYYRALTKLGARLKAAALAEPEWFRRFQRE